MRRASKALFVVATVLVFPLLCHAPAAAQPRATYKLAIADLGAANGAGQLPVRVIDSEGRFLEDLWVGATAHIEPFAIFEDSSKVVFCSEPYHALKLLDRATGQTRTLMTGGWGFNAPRWLPGSSSRFLFVSTVTGDGDICIYDTADGYMAALADPAGSD